MQASSPHRGRSAGAIDLKPRTEDRAKWFPITPSNRIEMPLRAAAGSTKLQIAVFQEGCSCLSLFFSIITVAYFDPISEQTALIHLLSLALLPIITEPSSPILRKDVSDYRNQPRPHHDGSRWLSP